MFFFIVYTFSDENRTGMRKILGPGALLKSSLLDETLFKITSLQNTDFFNRPAQMSNALKRSSPGRLASITGTC